MPTIMTMTDNPIMIDKSIVSITSKSTMTMTDNPTMSMTDNPAMIMADNQIMTDNPIMIDESTIIDNPIMIDKSIMTIDEDKLKMFLHATRVIRMYYERIKGWRTSDFDIPNFDEECRNSSKYNDIIDKFTKKYSNYSIWW